MSINLISSFNFWWPLRHEMRRRMARSKTANFSSILQKQHNEHALDMLDPSNFDPTFMARIITSDETWIYEFDM